MGSGHLPTLEHASTSSPTPFRALTHQLDRIASFNQQSQRYEFVDIPRSYLRPTPSAIACLTSAFSVAEAYRATSRPASPPRTRAP